MYTRRAGNKPTDAGAQSLGANPLANPNDYLLALSRHQANQTQPYSQALAQTGSVPQSGQLNPAVSQSFVSNAPGVPVAAQSQGLTPQQAMMFQRTLRTAQSAVGSGGQPFNPAKGVGVDGLKPSFDNRRDLMAAVVSAATKVGIAPEQIKSLGAEQIRALLKASNQNAGNVGTHGLNGRQNAGTGPSGNVDLPQSSAAGNIGNWMGQMVMNNRTTPNQAMNILQNPGLGFDKPENLLTRQSVPQQGRSDPAGVASTFPEVHGQRNLQRNNVSGMTSAQMAAFLEGKVGADKKAAWEALQRGNMASQMQLRGAVNNGSSGLSTANAQTGGQPAPVATDAEVWAKLEELQSKYGLSLQRLRPIIQRLQGNKPPQSQEQFMKYLNDCFNILNFKKTRQIPPRFNLQILNRAEQFMQQVIYVYSRHLKQMIRQWDADPKRQAEYLRQIDACTPASAGSTNPASGMAQNVSQDARPSEQTLSQNVIKQDGQSSHGMDPHTDSSQQRHYQQLQQAQTGRSTQTSNAHQMQFLKPVQQGGPYQATQTQQGGSEVLNNSTMGDEKINVKESVGKMTAQRGADAQKESRVPDGRVNGPVSVGVPDGRAATQAQVEAQVQAQLQAQAQAHVVGQMAAGMGVGQAVKNSSSVAANPGYSGLHQEHQKSEPQEHQGNINQQQLPRAHGVTNRPVMSRGTPIPNGRPTGQNGSLVSAGAAVEGQISGQVKVQAVANGFVSTEDDKEAARAVGSTIPDPGQKPQQPLSVEDRFRALDTTVREAVEYAQRFELYVESEGRKAKNERIQNTLAALRNNVGASGIAGSKHGVKRQSCLVDVDNFATQGVVSSKTVFECSGETGLRLAKKPRNEVADVKTVRDAVEADCKAAKERNPMLMIEITEEFGQPVVTCLLNIPEIRLPKLVLRVQRGYPRKGGATYGFERPPMGWVGVLDEIRTRFKQALATAPAASVGVAAFLDAWAREADIVINGSQLSESN